MAHFTIIGTGNMAKAIGGVLADGGSDVDYIAEDETGTAPLAGDTVVLAVPFGAVDSIIAAYGEQFAGKTVVDITNPVNFETFDSLVVPADSSAAAVIQGKLASSTVLKAFNTTFAGTLAAKKVGENVTTVQIAGNDDAAKAALAAAIQAGGVNAIDAGSLSRARELEAMGFLQISLAAREILPWTSGYAVVR